MRTSHLPDGRLPPIERRTKAAIEERVQQLWYMCQNWGELEKLAGITDRNAWWRDHSTEDSAREEIRHLLREKIARGEL